MYLGTRIITPHQNLNSFFANLLEFLFMAYLRPVAQLRRFKTFDFRQSSPLAL